MGHNYQKKAEDNKALYYNNDDEGVRLLFPEDQQSSSMSCSLSHQQKVTTITKTHVLGMFMIAMASLAVSCSATMVKIGSNFFPSTQILFIRHCLQASVTWYGCYRLGIFPLALGNARKWVLIRGVVGSFSSLFWYYSIKNLPLADVTGMYIYIDKIILSRTIFLLLNKNYCCN